MKKVVAFFVTLVVIVAAVLIIMALTPESPYDYIFYLKEKEDGTYSVNGIEGSDRESDVLTIYHDYEGKKVTEVSFDTIVHGSDKIKSIVIEEGIEHISGGGLIGFDNVEKITLPSTLKSCPPLPGGVELTFASNDYLDYKSGCIIDKATNTVIAATDGCTIPEGVKEIASWAFSNIEVADFSLPESLEIIHTYAFCNAKAGESANIVFGKNLKKVYRDAFSGVSFDRVTISTDALFDTYAFSKVKLNTLVFDSVPSVYEDIDNPEVRYRLAFSHDCGMIGGYYESNAIKRDTPCVNEQVESDLDGYRKYDPYSVVNEESGTSFLFFGPY